MTNDRGREKQIQSPDSDKKKRGSLFRRPSLSRRKAKDENSTRRAKSRDRAEHNTEQLPVDLADKKKSSSLPRDSKSPFSRGSKSKNKDANRRKTLDLDSKSATSILPLNELMKRTGSYNNDIPEIVLVTITEIESRGLNAEEIYKINAPKADIAKIIAAFDKLEEVDISHTEINTVAGALKGFLRALPGSIFDCIHDRLEECVKDMESFVTRSNKLFESPLFPRHNFHICSWLFCHLANVAAQHEKNKMSDEALSLVWCPILSVTKELFVNLIKFSSQFFGTVAFDRGRQVLRWMDSSAELKIPSDANEEWLEEEITSQEVVLAKLHNLENPDKQCEERMWEVQRIKTALKRKHKQIRKQREEQNRKEEEELKTMLKEEQRAIIEQEELLRMQQELRLRLEEEKSKVENLRSKLPMVEKSKVNSINIDEDELTVILDELVKENARLESENAELVSRINEERESLLTARIEHRISRPS